MISKIFNDTKKILNFKDVLYQVKFSLFYIQQLFKTQGFLVIFKKFL